MVTAKVIDMDALRRSAFEGQGELAAVSRTWLQDVYNALSGEPYVATQGPAGPELRQVSAIAA